MSEENFLLTLFQKIAEKLGKTYSEVQPFANILKENWYETANDINKLTDEDFQKMKIPLRVSKLIKQEILAMQNKQNVQIQSQIQKPSKKIQLNQSSMSALIMQFTQQISKQTNNLLDIEKFIKRLRTIISNIIKDPYEIKFRILKKSNKAIFQTFYQHPSCMKFFKSIGFQQNEEGLLMNVAQTHELFYLQQSLDNVLTRINQKLNKQIKVDEPPSYLTNIKFPQKSPEEAFSKEQLQNTNYADSLDRLIQYRYKLMAEKPKDRKLKIYHKRFQNKHINIQQQDLQTIFAQSDDEVIRAYWKQMIEKNRASKNFQSKRKMQFEHLIKQKIYKQAIIKIKLHNQLIIQGVFGPMQKLQDVLDWVSGIVVGEIYLYTSPPKKKMDKQLKMDLQSLDCCPMGSFYLGINEQWYITSEYAKIIQQ